jgi:hypothetical protein
MAIQIEGRLRHQLDSWLVGYAVSFEFLRPEDRADRLSRNVGKKLPLLAAEA